VRRVRPLHRRFSGGFALLELLVTIGLVLLVMVLVGATLLNGATSATTARLRGEQEAELLRVMSAMRRQIITIATSAATSTSVVGEIGREPNTDWLDMVTSSLVFSKGVGHAEWRIIRTPGEAPYLGYREAPWIGGERLHDNTWMPYSRLITGMKVRYWSNPEFIEGWKRDEVPERIEVTLFYIDEGQTASATFEAFPGIGGSSAAASAPAPGASSSPGSSATPSPSPSRQSTSGSTIPQSGASNPTSSSTGGTR